MRFNRNLPTRCHKTCLKMRACKFGRVLNRNKFSPLCPLGGGNGTGRLMSWDIHYRPLESTFCRKKYKKLVSRFVYHMTVKKKKEIKK